VNFHGFDDPPEIRRWQMPDVLENYVSKDHPVGFGCDPQRNRVDISAQEYSTISNLSAGEKSEQDRGDKQQPGKTSNWIVNGLAQIAQYPLLITVFVCVLCGTVGLARYLNFGGLLGSAGLDLAAASLLRPSPWWVPIVAPIIGSYK